MTEQVGDREGQFKGLGFKAGKWGWGSDLSKMVKVTISISFTYTPLTSVSRAFLVTWV